MPVTIDHRPLACDLLGLRTVGQLLSHLRNDNRLVKRIIIDGHEPDPAALRSITASSLDRHTVQIATADIRQMARQVISHLAQQIDEADRLRNQVVELLQCGQQSKAAERLKGWLSTCRHIRQTITSTARLLQIDPLRFVIDGRALATLFRDSAGYLQQIQSLLDNREFDALEHLLRHDASTARWQRVLILLPHAQPLPIAAIPA